MIHRILASLGTGTIFVLCLTLLLPKAFQDISHWMETTGVIVEQRVSRHDRRKRSDDFLLHLTYEYEVGGTNHRGSQFSMMHSSAKRGNAENEEQALRQMGLSLPLPTKVYYDPDDPARAVLDKAVPTSSRWAIVVSTVVCGLLFVAALMGKLRRGR